MDRSSSVRKSLRPRSKPVNYCKLNSGPDLQLEREQPRGSRGKKWSTSKLYELVVTDTKFEEDKLLVKVHYTDEEWSSPIYDEWRDAGDVTDIPDCYISCSPESRDLFFHQLLASIKESLHGQRKTDSVVNIAISIQRQLFDELASFGVKVSGSRFTLKSPLDLNCVLGEGWHWRIFNSQGDFSFIESGTVTFWLKEKRPLEEYSPDSRLILTHRGFIFHLRFI